MTRLAAWCALACTMACATAPPRAPPNKLRVDDASDERVAVFVDAATFTLRKPERVVTLKGLGEIHVGVGGDASACRLVWSRAGLDRLAILTGDGACATLEDHRLCFNRAMFSRPLGTPDDAPLRLVVDGCADENDLAWSKLQGPQEATVGPALYRTRCAQVPQKKKCPLTYLRLVDLHVDTNDAPREGFSFSYQPDDDRWRACFVEKESGRYAVALEIEDACGAAGPSTVAGDSHDLDD